MSQRKPVTSIRLDPRLKEQATKIFNQLGMSFSSGIEIYLYAVIQNNGIPFSLTLEENTEKK